MFGTGDSQYFSVYTVRFGTERTNHNAMESIVYILQKSNITPGANAHALRAGLLMSTITYSVGDAYMYILYDDMSKEANKSIERKILLLASHPEFEQFNASASELIANMRMLWSQRRNTAALMQYKRLESIINKITSNYMSIAKEGMRDLSLIQLAPLRDHDMFTIFGLASEDGEKYGEEYSISKILSLYKDEGYTEGPFAFILIDRLAQLSPKDEASLIQVFTLPNINLLTLDQLLGARKALSYSMEKLQKLLLLDHTSSNYTEAHWHRAPLAETGEAIQHAIDTNPDLSWAAAHAPKFRSTVLVGEMDTHRFWQLQRDCNQMPDDSWALLQNLPSETPYPRTVPVIVIRPNIGFSDPNDEQAEESLEHKRKTISLD